MPIVPQRLIFPGNDFVIERALYRRNERTGLSTPAVGLVGVIGFLADEQGGDAIDPSLEIGLVERDDVPGQYYGVVQGSDLDTHLTEDYDRETIYECVEVGTDYRSYVAIIVRFVREET